MGGCPPVGCVTVEHPANFVANLVKETQRFFLSASGANWNVGPAVTAIRLPGKNRPCLISRSADRNYRFHFLGWKRFHMLQPERRDFDFNFRHHFNHAQMIRAAAFEPTLRTSNITRARAQNTFTEATATGISGAERLPGIRRRAALRPERLGVDLRVACLPKTLG